MRVVFFGTSPFAVPSLEALLESGKHQILAVVTQPDRPSGRGMQLQESPVKKYATAHGLPILQPERVRRKPFPETLRSLAPDVLVVVSFGQIIPQAVLDIAPHGGVNVHASLLPRWRGAAPIHRAIEAGDPETGVATMLMEATLDTGPVYRELRVPIAPADTTGSLEPVLAAHGAALLLQTLDDLASGAANPTPQSAVGETYAKMIDRDDTLLDPSTRTAAQLDCQIRAFSPRPGTFLNIGGREVKILDATVEAGDSPPGTVVSSGKDGIRVGTVSGILMLKKVQPSGKPAMDAGAYANGARLAPGTPATRPESR